MDDLESLARKVQVLTNICSRLEARIALLEKHSPMLSEIATDWEKDQRARDELATVPRGQIGARASNLHGGENPPATD